MSALDIFLGIFLLIGLYKGFNKGLLLELASLIALLAGIYGAIHFSYIAGDYLSQKMNWEERYINLAAFLVTFIGIVIAVHFAGKLLTKVADIAMLGFLNKLAGGVFGVLKVGLILAAIIIFFDRANDTLSIVSEETKTESALYYPIKNTGAYIYDSILRKDIPNLLDTQEN